MKKFQFKKRYMLFVVLAILVIAGCASNGIGKTKPVFETENISRITFCSSVNAVGEVEVPGEHIAEITQWLGTFTLGKEIKGEAVPPGTNSVSVRIEYTDGTVVENGLSTIHVDGVRYFLESEDAPECYSDIMSQPETPELPPFEAAMKECLKGIDLLTDYEGESVQVGDRVAVYVRQFDTTKKDGHWGSEKIGSLLETYKGDLLWENEPDYRWYYDENGEEKDGLPPLKWSIETQSDWYSVKGENDLELLIREQTSGRISLWEFEKFVGAQGINAVRCATMFPDVTNYEPYTEEDVVRLIYKGNAPQIKVDPATAFDTLMRDFKYRGSHDPSLSNYLVHGAHANAFPEYYGGAYVDGENLVILLTDSFSREERELRADQYARELYPRNKPLIISEDRLLFRPENIVFEDAQFSYQELIVVYSRILDYKKAMDAAEEYTIENCGIDDRNNRVVVYLNEIDDGARQWFAERVTDAPCVVFRESEE